jgi:hypothetical protein
MARHLSMVADRRSQRAQHSGYDEVATDNADPLTPLEEAASLDTSIGSPLALQPAGSKGSDAAAAEGTAKAAEGVAAVGKAKDIERASMGLSGLSSIGSGGTPEQRRQWVLHKLRGLVDAVKQLEVDAFSERSENANQTGLPAFMLMVHSCVNLTRQCGTCLTALDPEHGRQLHAYYREAREAAAKACLLPREAMSLL